MAMEKELLDQLPHAVEWLSDNGSPFTAKETDQCYVPANHNPDLQCI
jgi:hypothetical protein